jgi:hypothetical protein
LPVNQEMIIKHLVSLRCGVEHQWAAVHLPSIFLWPQKSTKAEEEALCIALGGQMEKQGWGLVITNLRVEGFSLSF